MSLWRAVFIQLLPPLGHTGDQGGRQDGHFLYSNEGVNQRDPLAMVTYGLSILPIILELQKAHFRFT